MIHLKEFRARVENAKLSSDDHEHDTTALREYCERELIWAYDVAMPELIDRCEAYEEALKFYADKDTFVKNSFVGDVFCPADQMKMSRNAGDYAREALAKFQEKS